jgi:iron complex outermembrane receptor protein
MFKTALILVSTTISLNSLAQSSDLESQEQSIEKIVVNGFKLKQTILETPNSVTVLSRELIKRANIEDLRDISKIAPNVSVNQIGQVGPTSISIRGIQSNPFVVNRVAVYVDGIPFRDPGTIQLNNIEQIEILRGPQSTLYGANANAGIIIINSQAPDGEEGGQIGLKLKAFEGRATQEVNGNIYANLNTNLSSIFNFRYEHGDSYVKNIASSIDEQGEINDLALSTRLRYQFNDDTQLNMMGIYNEIDAPGLYEQEFAPLDIDAYNALYAESFNAGLTVGDFEIANDAPKQTNSKEWALGLALEKDYDAGVFHVVSSYRNRDDESYGTDLDLTAAAFSAGGTQLKDIFWNLETRFNSAENEVVQWVIGLNYLYQERTRKLSTLIGPGNIDDFSPAPEQRFDTKDTAIFGQVIYPLTDQLNMTFGLRYELASREIEQDAGELDLGALGVFGFPEVAQSEQDKTLIPKFSLSYVFDNELSVYTTMTKGYLPGNYNLVVAGNGADIANEFGSYDKEQLWSYEIGSKGYLFQNKLFFSVAAFYIDANTWQENRILTDAEGRVLSTNLISSDAAIKSQGLEAELSGYLTKKLSINLGFGYTDAQYKDYPFTSTQNLKGNSVYLIPKFDAYLGLIYRFTDHWYVQADLQAIGKTPLNPEGTAVRDKQYIGGLSAGYETDKWSVSINVENISNQRYAAGQAYQNFLFGDDGNFYAPLASPRMIGLAVKMTF